MIDVQLQSQDFKAVVTVDGRLFTEYRYGHFVCRPYFYPVLTPGGQRLTRGYPTEENEGETDDHFHHRSIYTAHEMVNGFNLWAEGHGHGAMLQRGEPVVGLAGDAATIDGIVDWFGPEGQRLLEERRTIHIRAVGDLRVMDQRNELRARYGDVTLGDTKDAGLLSLRVATSMDATGDGRIENSEGGVFDSGHGEEVTWGKRAAWCDYSGPLANGEEWGHTMVDHPKNPRYPTYWMVRGYGLFTANPFGVSRFEADDNLDASMTISAGDSVVFRYRLIIHPGRGPGDRQVSELVEEFGNEDYAIQP